MKRILHAFLPLVLLSVILAGCKKKPGPDPIEENGSAKIEFSNVVGSQPLEMNGRWYRNEHGDSFQVNTYKYYISNISLVTAAGAETTVPDSYFLIDAADAASRKITLSGLTAATYTKLRFLIGVDSARNVDGAQTGALDPAHGMFWTWNTGYIMAKLEGISPQSTEPGNTLIFHLGGFKGPKRALRWIELPINSGATVSGTKTPNLHVVADVLQWFKTPNVTDFSVTNNIMGGINATVEMADNYSDMFVVDHVD